ncbi:1-deoxy-D-xylulose-5-phosphate reductoisomerase [Oscillibacter sp.]|jgi:1-deoxy-D-xylulose-5-phosphate reductoisomerase|uniref:1-deoxy-D-xylulose-5-phosphate reductoisomerase n=1 Tax=Oscillibacter sp. TaxID=1945593 RepID=UPI00216C75D8|nr:1-deoxy-D-xylulose-5-phosphate reductoisomerase [Oscillibacter sp.]MCI9648908.1 1-deoxy-D-xylulose-5-phosphate reductoisomerase [Oscillibacter sp.]
MTNTISILGSTGSIGRQTLDVAKQLGLRVAALTANSSVERAEEQARKFRPCLVVMTDEAAARDLAVRLRDTETRVLGGAAALEEAAALPAADTVVTAVVGMVGLKPTLAAIDEKKRIALANKETLVCAGELVMDAAERSGAEIVPVDSEHSAIFQCLQGCGNRREIRRLILTCSGGPFYGMNTEEAGRMTKKDALKHPNWTMGPKITVDCATLMNKGLEVIEAMRLYRLPLERVDVVIHRQSIVHSLVEFWDGAVLAQLGTPDMRLPIRYAMTYPERAESPLEPLDLLVCPPLTFSKPDRRTFPCLALAEEAAVRGGTACAALNGANEEAVRLFLAEKIGFYDIFHLTRKAMAALPVVEHPTLEEILEADREAREIVSKEHLA